MTSEAEPPWYAVIDTAQDPVLHPLAIRCRDVQCLVAGDIPPVLVATLPHLVRIHTDEPLLERWRAAGIGRGWGIMLQTGLSRDALRLRLKTFLNAQLPDGSVTWFRFYDPLVLRSLFRASTPAELAPWFRGVRQFVVEGDRPDRLHRLTLEEGRLVETDVATRPS